MSELGGKVGGEPLTSVSFSKSLNLLWHASEYNEKNDVQKLNKPVKSKSVVGKELIKKIKAHWTNVSLWIRAA